jgi:soluble lytic murein transglycosylase
MNIIARVLCGACLALVTCASTTPSEPSYLERFVAYLSWSKSLPNPPTPAFIAFIDSDAPLSQKLREKWLYQLAKNDAWDTYTTHYKPSSDPSLQCYEQLALYQQGHQKEAITHAKTLWLTGNNMPAACDKLFKQLIEDKCITRDLILERIALALEKRNVSLAKYLITQAELSNPYEKRMLEIIQKQPTRITSLSPSSLHSNYYLYGLKRLVSSNPKRAIELFQKGNEQALLSNEQKQAFLAHLALYKAIRNKPDSSSWFDKIEADAYNETLLDWQIRFSLRQHEWKRVKSLINSSNKQEEPAWQYWYARADEATGAHEAARIRYQTLAQKRHYYGFLASVRLNQPMVFEQEEANHMDTALLPYQPIIEKIKTLYENKQRLQASRMANDFASELPKDKKSAFIAWLADVLHWTGKSVYLSGDKSLKNQLSLRFPLAHKTLVQQYSKQYDVPEALIYAIIRQESAFRGQVISPVGAHGLMQLMPKTAQHVARREHIAYHGTRDLFSSEKNINLGTAYLSELAKRFNNNPLLMVAAYNAGPNQVNRWTKTHPIEEIDIWIDTLPWGETRNYLKSVMAFYAVYQHRLHTTPSLATFMHQDIKHNNPRKDSQSANQLESQTQKDTPLKVSS